MNRRSTLSGFKRSNCCSEICLNSRRYLTGRSSYERIHQLLHVVLMTISFMLESVKNNKSCEILRRHDLWRLCIFWSGFILESYLISNHTVGRNPASPGMVLKPCKIMGYSKNQPQLVSWTRMSFHHQRYDATNCPPAKKFDRLTVRVQLLVLSIGWPHPPGKLDPRTTAGPANFGGEPRIFWTRKFQPFEKVKCTV